MAHIFDKLSRGTCLFVDRDPDPEVEREIGTYSALRDEPVPAPSLTERPEPEKSKPGKSKPGRSKAGRKSQSSSEVVSLIRSVEDTWTIQRISEEKPPRRVVVQYLKDRLARIQASEDSSDDES